jgi:hypothetical protein
LQDYDLDARIALACDDEMPQPGGAFSQPPSQAAFSDCLPGESAAAASRGPAVPGSVDYCAWDLGTLRELETSLQLEISKAEVAKLEATRMKQLLDGIPVQLRRAQDS